MKKKESVLNLPPWEQLDLQDGNTEYEVTLEKVGIGKTNEDSFWAELRMDYDPTDASFGELCDLSARLYQKGVLSRYEHAMLTFNSQRVAPGMTVRKPALAERRDWLQELSERARHNRYMGNMQGFLCDMRLVEVLRRLQ
nr:hypothetical protein [uncultured Anaeromusa sp.]